jgi:hypothetical protein
MKKFKVSLIIIAIGIIFSTGVIAQPQPPAPPSNQGTSGNQSPAGGGPAGAPIDGGLSVLLSFALIYGIRKGLRARGNECKRVGDHLILPK